MNTTRKKLPVGIQSFETMRTEQYLYVDKTRHIYQMVASDKFCFLSRPGTGSVLFHLRSPSNQAIRGRGHENIRQKSWTT